MSSFELKFFGWYYIPDNGNDKIWGYAQTSFGYASFWGKRSPDGSIKSIKFKKHTEHEGAKLEKTAKKKAETDLSNWHPNYNPDARYKPISLEMVDGEYPKVDEVYPDFVKQMRKQLFTALIANKIK